MNTIKAPKPIIKGEFCALEPRPMKVLTPIEYKEPLAEQATRRENKISGQQIRGGIIGTRANSMLIRQMGVRHDGQCGAIDKWTE